MRDTLKHKLAIFGLVAGTAAATLISAGMARAELNPAGVAAAALAAREYVCNMDDFSASVAAMRKAVEAAGEAEQTRRDIADLAWRIIGEVADNPNDFCGFTAAVRLNG